MFRRVASIAPLLLLLACRRSSESAHGDPATASSADPRPFTWSIDGGPEMDGYALIRGRSLVITPSLLSCKGAKEQPEGPWLSVGLHPGPGGRWFVGEPTVGSAGAHLGTGRPRLGSATIAIDAPGSSLEGASITLTLLPDVKGTFTGSGTIKPILCELPPAIGVPLAEHADDRPAHGHLASAWFSATDVIARPFRGSFEIRLFNHPPPPRTDGTATSWCDLGTWAWLDLPLPPPPPYVFFFTRNSDVDLRYGVDWRGSDGTRESMGKLGGDGWVRLRSIDVAAKKIEGEIVVADATSDVTGTFTATICPR